MLEHRFDHDRVSLEHHWGSSLLALQEARCGSGFSSCHRVGGDESLTITTKSTPGVEQIAIWAPEWANQGSVRRFRHVYYTIRIVVNPNWVEKFIWHFCASDRAQQLAYLILSQVEERYLTRRRIREYRIHSDHLAVKHHYVGGAGFEAFNKSGRRSRRCH
jgi:hypothetical protein